MRSKNKGSCEIYNWEENEKVHMVGNGTPRRKETKEKCQTKVLLMLQYIFFPFNIP